MTFMKLVFWNNHKQFTLTVFPSHHFLKSLQFAEASLMLFLIYLFLGVRTDYQGKI